MAPNNVVPIKPNPKIKPGAEYVSGSPYLVDMPRVLPRSENHSRGNGVPYLDDVIISQMLTDPDVYAGFMLLALMAMNEQLLVTPAISETPQDVHAKEDAAPLPQTAADTTQDAAPLPQTAADTTQDNVPIDNVAGVDKSKPAPSQQPDPKLTLAKDISDFCQRQIERVPTFQQIVFSMIFEGMTRGNKAAELVLEVAQRGTDVGRWCAKDVKPKPREAVAFVVDAYMNIIGLLGAKPGQASVVQTTMVADDTDIIPREKFMVFTHRKADGDPRGNTPEMLAALNGFDMKRRTFPEYLIFLMVSAIPGILATLAAGATEITLYEDDGVTPRRNPETGEPITVEAHQYLLTMLSQMRNHQVGVAPEGTEFTLLQTNSEGKQFIDALNKAGAEITMAILHQALGTRDSEHQTKGATGEQSHIIDYIVWNIRDNAAAMVRYDFFKPLVRYNFGDDAADELLPKCSYGDTEARHWSENATAASSLAPNLTESQWDYVTSQLGIPAPTEAERQYKRMAKDLMQQGQQAALNAPDSAGNNDKTDNKTPIGGSSDKTKGKPVK